MSDPEQPKRDFIRETVESTVSEEYFSHEKLEEMIRRREEERREIYRNISVTTPDSEWDPESEKKYRPVIGLKSLGHTGPKKFNDTSVPSKRYEPGDPLGEGGSGFVFSAFDNSFMREVALKVIRPRNAEHQKKVERFINEARISANLEHPGILPVYDIGFTKTGEVYFTMRKVKGTTLGDAVRSAEKGKVPERIALFSERCEIMVRVCDAIAYAHDRGFVHQDIKPDNILLGEFGEVLIVDWGTASKGENLITKKKNMFGTPAYMSPEQARREQSDHRSDVYCLGATLFHLLTFTFPTWSEDMEDFWKKKRNGIIDPIPAEIKKKIPVYLLDITYRAMAADPEQRYQSAADLRTALKNFQSHIESINLCMSAMKDFYRAEESGEYSSFARARFGFEQALSAWSENTDARKGLSLADSSHALCAIKKGDLEIARGLINRDDPDHSEAVRQLDAALLKRGKRIKRTAAFRIIGTAAVILLVIAGWYLAIDYYKHIGRWEKVFDQDFSSDTGTGELLFCGHEITRKIQADPVDNGSLDLSMGNILWLFHPDLDKPDTGVPGNVRAEATIVWPEVVDGFEIFINAKYENPERYPMHPAGYSCQFGGWRGNISFIGRNPEPGYVNSSNGVYVPYRPGVEYTVALQRVDDEVSLWVDGKKVYSYQDLLPLSGKDFRYVGFRTWGKGIHIKRLVVRRMALPEKSTSLIAGDRMYMKGHIESALEEYLRLSSDLPKGSVAEKALAKAYFVTHRIKSVDQNLRTTIMTRMRNEYPESRYLVRMLEADCIAFWEEQEYTKVFSLCEEIFRLDPDTRVMLELIDRRPQTGLSAENLRMLLRYLAVTTRITRLSLNEWGFTDLSPLSGLQLTGLSIGKNRITDLTPLKGMKLEILNIAENEVSSLTPLKDMPLETLHLTKNNLQTLKGIENCPLVQLDCGENPVRDITPLSKITTLKTLDLSGTEISDLGPLRELELEDLWIWRCSSLSSLTPLKGMKSLQRLGARYMKLSLDGLQGTGLSGLFTESCGISDLTPLSGLKTLRILNVKRNNIDSLEPLKGLDLETLNFSENSISDLTPLRNIPLKYLDCSHNPISTIEPLRNKHSLLTLNIRSAGIRSLKSLEGLSLTWLECRNNPLENLKPFESRLPFPIIFETGSLDDEYISKVLEAWEKDNPEQRGRSIRKNRILRALRNDDGKYLKSISVHSPTGRYVFVDDYYLWNDAKEKAEAVGGHLLTINSRQELDWVRTWIKDKMGVKDDIWIGMYDASDGNPAWVTGEIFNSGLFRNMLERNPEVKGQYFLFTFYSLYLQQDNGTDRRKKFIVEFPVSAE